MISESEQSLLDYNEYMRNVVLTGGTINGKEMFANLERLDASEVDTGLFLESFVLCAALSGMRPARAHGRMGRLRDLRFRDGEPEKYEEFERFLSKGRNGLVFTQHGFDKPQFEGANQSAVFEQLRGLIDRLHDLGLVVFVNSGTLLGLVRDKKLITYDDDIDLVVMLEARTDAEAATEFKGLVPKLADAGINARRKKGIIKLPSIEGFVVDLFPGYGPRERYNIFPYSRKKLKLRYVLPIRECSVSGLPLPSRPEVLLELNYGNDWRTPNRRFVFPWHKQGPKFKTFLEAVK